MSPPRIRAFTVDCADPHALAAFRSRALGHPLHSQGPPLLFIGVPEPKTLKNRLHLDLEAAPGSTRDTEVERLLALGATLVHDLRGGLGTDWAVLADPEGNEFCVVRADHEP